MRKNQDTTQAQPAPNTKHTPGPWSFSEATQKNYGGGIIHYESAVHVGSYENRGNTIALVGMGGNGAIYSSKEDVEANARLIAAAPDLLKALKQIDEWLIGTCDPIENRELWHPQFVKSYDLASAAIAKAEGR